MSEKIHEEIKKIKEKLENHERRISEIEKILPQEPTQAIMKPLSINEFLSQKSPKSDMDKTLAMGYFLEKYEKISPFNVKDLKDIFIQAREPLPSNLNDMVNLNIKKGYMMEAKEKKNKLKAFVLTNSGAKFVESGFSEAKK